MTSRTDLKLIDEFEAQIESLGKVDDFLVRGLDRDSLGQAVLFDLKLAIEETFTNIVQHALERPQVDKITIQLRVTEESVHVEIFDTGKAFNPLTAVDPDLDVPPDERPLGGMGIFLVKQLMDNVTYRRDENRNILTLRKNID